MSRPLDSILTAIDCDQLDLQSQIANVRSWKASTGRLFVSSQFSLLDCKELDWHAHKKSRPPLRDVLQAHLMRMRGMEAIGIGAPGITLRTDFGPVFDLKSQHRMEMAWAFWARTTESVLPRFFIVSTAVVHHLLNDVPAYITLSGSEWSRWMHEKLLTIMPPKRYVDVSEHYLVSEVPSPVTFQPFVAPVTLSTVDAPVTVTANFPEGAPTVAVFSDSKAPSSLDLAPVDTQVATAEEKPVKALETPPVVKRKGGRPKGSKNRFQRAKAPAPAVVSETV